MNIALIPARMGSQRLPKKNLRTLDGLPIITRAIRKCKQADCFDEIWVNSENTTFRDIALEEGVNFHHRPQKLGGNQITSEQYIAEFLQHHECNNLFQVHSIAPLLSISSIRNFVNEFISRDFDCLLSVEDIQIECVYKGKPINFNYNQKTNSQDLTAVQRISWSITAWRKKTFLDAYEKGNCATFSGKVGFYPVNPLSAHVIKTELDLMIADALLPLVESDHEEIH